MFHAHNLAQMKMCLPSLVLFLALIAMLPGCGVTDSDEEESGTRYKLTEAATQTRSGVDLVIGYDQNTRKFNGTVTNTNDTAVNDVRVEIHLSNGTELGPTPRTGLAPQEAKPVTLDAANQEFNWWTVHVELGGSSG